MRENPFYNRHYPTPHETVPFGDMATQMVGRLDENGRVAQLQEGGSGRHAGDAAADDHDVVLAHGARNI